MRVRIGYSAWIVGVVQFFIIHRITESAWARPYSWARNNISDLGNVTALCNQILRRGTSVPPTTV